MRYNHNNVPRDREVWACAYDTNNTEKSMGLRKKPVKGIVKGSGGWYDTYFYEFKKNGEMKKSNFVRAESRFYADTETECNDMYNEFVNKQISLLRGLIRKCEEDLIPLYVPVCEHGFEDCIHDPARRLYEYDNGDSWVRDRYTREELEQCVKDGCHCEEGCDFDDEDK